MFKWATAEELLPGAIYNALLAVPGLKAGRSDARETEDVKPAPQEHVDAIEPYVSRQVWAMVQLQLLTAARPGEICKMRPCDIDTSGKIWFYCPAEHKTAHHGHDRKIYIGPKGQEVLRPFLLRPVESYSSRQPRRRRAGGSKCMRTAKHTLSAAICRDQLQGKPQAEKRRCLYQNLLL